MPQICPTCNQAALFTNSSCPSCGRDSRAPERIPTDPIDIQRDDEQTRANATKLVGIEGWLMIPATGLVLSLVITPVVMFINLAGKNSAYTVLSLTIQTGYYIWLWVTTFRFFGKRRTAPSALIQLLLAKFAASACLFFLNLMMVKGVDGFKLLRSNNIILHGILAAIWIAYLRKSRRVMHTFVH